jgi:hypothetical protein
MVLLLLCCGALPRLPAVVDQAGRAGELGPGLRVWAGFGIWGGAGERRVSPVAGTGGAYLWRPARMRLGSLRIPPLSPFGRSVILVQPLWFSHFAHPPLVCLFALFSFRPFFMPPSARLFLVLSFALFPPSLFFPHLSELPAWAAPFRGRRRRGGPGQPLFIFWRVSLFYKHNLNHLDGQCLRCSQKGGTPNV